MATEPKTYDTRQLYDLVRRPLITEKATLLLEQNQYLFEVALKATKPEIKAAIELIFGVSVTKVNTLRPPRKKRRVGRFIGFKAQYKKAIVTLAPDDKIALFPDV